MQGVGASLLVHWQPVASAAAPRSLELPLARYTTDAPGACGTNDTQTFHPDTAATQGGKQQEEVAS